MINLIRQEIIIYLTGLKFEIMKENSKNALKFYTKIHKTEYMLMKLHQMPLDGSSSAQFKIYV